MKKILFILTILFASVTCFSQSIVPRANSSYTVQDSRFSAALNLFVPRYADTTAANLAKGIDSLAAIIYTYDVQSFWGRSYSSGKKWVALGSGGGGGSGTVTNIATGLGLSGGPITTTGTLLVDTADASILSRQRAALTYAPISITGTVTSVATGLGLSGGTITGSGTLLVDTSSASILSRQRAAATYALIGDVTNPFLKTSGTATATGSIIGDLSGNTLQIQQGGENFLNFVTTVGGESSTIRAFNSTAGDNVAFGGFNTADDNAQFQLQSTFDGASKLASIIGLTNVSTSTLTYTADTNIVNGGIILNSLAAGSTTDSVMVWNASTKAVGYVSPSSLFSTPGIDDVLAVGQALTSNRTVDLGTHELDFANGQVGINMFGAFVANRAFTVQNGLDDIDLLHVDTSPNAEHSIIKALNTATIGDEGVTVGYFEGNTSDTHAQFETQASFNGGTKTAVITGWADATVSTIDYTADTHNFTGNVLPTTDDTYTLGDDTHRWADIFLGPSTAHIGTSTSDEGSLSYNTSTNVLSIASTGTLAITAATTLTGNFLTATNNTYDIGDATNSFKDIYSRTVKLDGSTSGTVTINSDALANALNSTTLSGAGISPSTMFAIQKSNNSLSDINTVQSVFSSSFDVWTLQASQTYYFRGFYSFTHGATSHSVSMSFATGGAGSISAIYYYAIASPIAVNTVTATQTATFVTQTSATAVNQAGANNAEQIWFSGYITTSSGGTVTVTPQITFSAPPGGSPATLAGSYIQFTPFGTDAVTSLGNVN